jgi:hypothetical protein
MLNVNEIMLAQEQSVVNKPTHLGILSEVEGTLILTNKRLIFVTTSEQSQNVGVNLGVGGGILTFSDIDEINSIPSSPANTFIPIQSIISVSGHKGIMGPPVLRVKWQDESGEKSTEFKETLIGKRRKNLNDWAAVISGIKSGTQKIIDLPPAPSRDTLEGKILSVLGDMQEKGLLEIEEQTEEQFKLDLEPDDVEAACEKLVSLGLVDKIPDPSGDEFYKKRSPLGEDDLSS